MRLDKYRYRSEWIGTTTDKAVAFGTSWAPIKPLTNCRGCNDDCACWGECRTSELLEHQLVADTLARRERLLGDLAGKRLLMRRMDRTSQANAGRVGVDPDAVRQIGVCA